jgi:hypothetical protein
VIRWLDKREMSKRENGFANREFRVPNFQFPIPSFEGRMLDSTPSSIMLPAASTNPEDSPSKTRACSKAGCARKCSDSSPWGVAPLWGTFPLEFALIVIQAS